MTKPEIFTYTASHLTTFLECHHATFLDLKHLKGELQKHASDSTAQLLQKKGDEHETLYLNQLKDSGKKVIEVSKDRSLEDKVQMTLDAMKEGVDVIYQAVLTDGLWRGDADFLIKCETPSGLGSYSYEVVDTKLARTPEAKHIIQLCVYSDLLAALQSLQPHQMHLVLGDLQKESFRVSDYFSYYTGARRRFESYINNVPETSDPEPCSYCALCPWNELCTRVWEERNHLSLVAGIRHTQIEKLRQAGIDTVRQLAVTPANLRIPDLNPEVFKRLRSQAVLQTQKERTGKDEVEVLPLVPGKGFYRIPKAQEGDLFFDMEGDPLYPEGLEYLFGLHYLQEGKEVFKPFWAHSHEEEKRTFGLFMDFIREHLERFPKARIYHYNHYETTALKRLSCRYAYREKDVDNLLRQERFVDLYRVVLDSIRTSERGYSIKNLETFYMKKRENEVNTAAESIVVYNQWRETEDEVLLQRISDYNEVDCISTRMLRDWLLTLRPEGLPWFRETEEEKEIETPEQKDWEADYEAYRKKLGADREDTSEFHQLVSHLLEFHNREAKPQWWALFERQKKSEDELIDDPECLGGLVRIGDPEPEQRSLVYTYGFPPQDYKLKKGDSVKNTETNKSSGSIFELDDASCVIKLKLGNTKEPLPERLSIGPAGPVDSTKLRAALYRYADRVIAGEENTCAATEILKRRPPRIRGKSLGMPLVTSEDLQGEALKALLNLENSYLFIQGPPGAGKTYISSHLIVDLMQRGKKVGVTSNSHKAIHNLLERIEEVAQERGFEFKGVKKKGKSEDSQFAGRFFKDVGTLDAKTLEADLLAGTAWFFSEEALADHLDYLFIEEAGQVSLANVVAMSLSTANIVLVGDQMQLGQPIQGIHPGQAGLSVLDYLLGEKSTIEQDRGIFLAETRRLSSAICRFVSEAFYDGRLKTHESASKRALRLQETTLLQEGIVLIPVLHEGCSQKSEEEGKIIEVKYKELLGQTLQENDGSIRSLTSEDILVVTPYNVQVNYLRSLLPEGARVGTVDKFQGQEAPVVLISLVTSGAEDLPRNIEFLYSRNRLNVALSRAQCLAVVVFNPNLLEIPCKTVEQVKLVNTLCHLSDSVTKIDPSS